MTPEEKARVKIDRLFDEAGWKVVDRDHYTPTLTAAAIKEGMLEGHLEADYFLFINGKAVGVLEAKRKEVDVSGDVVMEQAKTYAKSVPSCYQAHAKPLPLIYTSNGENVYFQDFRDPDSPLEQIDRIHTPKEVVKRLGITDFWAALPTLHEKGLRACQHEAITELEKSYRTGQNRALMVLATGAGKTYTAVTASYRFLAFTPMKRVLFLVDRNNLAKQAESEFGQYRLTETGDPFNTIFGVERLKSSAIPNEANVVISTIQRVFSLLTGQEITDNEEDDDEDVAADDIKLTGELKLPHDFFDLIIIDECHRSIYGKWRKVLEHFDTARLIGLTATPVPETLAFFNNNRVVNYTLEQSIIDGVNVDCRVYRIKTEATENGGAIRKGDKLRRETIYTGKVETIDTKASKDYTPEELNRSIINPSQIKLILETYRDAIYTELFTDPQREPNLDWLPKTLIFALNERHANNIVKIAREVFGKEDDPKFVQKITYSSGDSNELIRQFRNDKEFRIAVTCTLVATGTDVKPLEVVMFLRDVNSEPLYIQMKGRGVRTIGDDQLRNVTPNAISKDCFFLIDAVGVTEHTMSIPEGGGEPGPETITLKKLLERLTHGEVPDNYLKALAGRLARISNKADEEQRQEFTRLTHGTSMAEMSSNIYTALESGELPPYKSIDQPNNERKGLVAALVNHPEAKTYLLTLCAGFVNTLMPGEDNLISKGFSQEEARDTTSAFEQYCETHKDEIEALRIIYNNNGERLTYAMLKDLEQKLRAYNSRFAPATLWNNYAVLYPDKVKARSTKEEQEALTNIIQLVRFAIRQNDRLESLYPQANSLFNLWWGRVQKDVTEPQVSLIKQVVNYIASNGFCSVGDIKVNFDKSLAAKLIRAFSGKENANAALDSVAQFILFRKTA